MEMLDQTVADIACGIPGATRVFNQHKLDFCCGGGHSLREAIAKRGVAPEVVLAELERLSAQPEADTDWRLASPAMLIDHIQGSYHSRHREQLPELVRLARRVEAVHGDKPACPLGLADHVAFLEQDIEAHMMKEEQILFPMILRGMYAQSISPIARMRQDHNQHGELLEKLDQLTHNITPPPDACNTWRALYAGLTRFREDLMQHIHLENNVLFPMVEKNAGGVTTGGDAGCSVCSACS